MDPKVKELIDSAEELAKVVKRMTELTNNLIETLDNIKNNPEFEYDDRT